MHEVGRDKAIENAGKTAHYCGNTRGCQYGWSVLLKQFADRIFGYSVHAQKLRGFFE
jgi:hypothetical protein